MAKPSESPSGTRSEMNTSCSRLMEFDADYAADVDDRNADSNDVNSTGQPLTPYHSRLSSLLSWEQPRTTAISFATVVATIIAARYLPLLRWALKLLYLSLGAAAIIEVAGRTVLSRGLTSTSRPRKYYTIPKDAVESVLEDMEQLVDFFLIEFQRILFVENLAYTFGAFSASFTSYWLVKFLPLWILALVGVTVAYLGPLVYISNKELIDEQIAAVQEIIDAQTNQVKEMAESQTAHATGVVKQYVNDYRAKAHDYVVSSRSPQASPEMEKPSPAKPEAKKATEPEIRQEPTPEPEPAPKPKPKRESAAEPASTVKQSDFPDAPRQEPAPEPKKEEPTPDLLSI